MGFRFTRIVKGREYEYERISTVRKGEKVITKDRYIGPKRPSITRQRWFDRLMPAEKKKLKQMWKEGITYTSIRDYIDDRLKFKPSESSVQQTLTKEFGKRIRARRALKF